MENKFPIPFCAKCKNSVFCSPQNPFHLLGDKISKKFLSFAKNESVYRAEETAKGIFCIYSGTIKIVKQINFNQEITIHKATDGEIIGFNSISKGRYTNTAIAMEDTTACFISLLEMNNLIKLLSSATEIILNSKC